MLERLDGALNALSQADLGHVAKRALGPVAAERALGGGQQDAVDGEVGLQVLEGAHQRPDDVLEDEGDEDDEEVGQLDVRAAVAETLDDVAHHGPERQRLLVGDEEGGPGDGRAEGQRVGGLDVRLGDIADVPTR